MRKRKTKPSVEELPALIKVESDYCTCIEKHLYATCEDASECGRVWRRFHALHLKEWDLTLYYGAEKEFYGSTILSRTDS
ncbi:MAG: hypothetical protein AAF329_20445 [Cyanobacteria bacterium P01_A01_bin.17]